MTDLRKLRLERWERIREAGIKRYILTYGTGYAAIMSVLFTILLLNDQRTREIPFIIPLTIILFLIGGCVYGAGMWWFSMWLYKREQSRGIK